MSDTVTLQDICSQMVQKVTQSKSVTESVPPSTEFRYLKFDCKILVWTVWLGSTPFVLLQEDVQSPKIGSEWLITLSPRVPTLKYYER